MSFPRDCCSQGPTESPPRLGPKKQSLASEAASSSDGLSCGSANSRASSPLAPHPESDYCSLRKEPGPGKQQDSGCHGVASSRCLGQTGETQPPAHSREAAQSEPIYAESTKRKKAVPVPSRPQAKAEQGAGTQGQAQVPLAHLCGLTSLLLSTSYFSFPTSHPLSGPFSSHNLGISPSP